MTTASPSSTGLDVALGRSRLEAIPRDPHTAWVYWELTAESMREALGPLDSLPPLELQVRGRSGSEALVSSSYFVSHWVAGQFVEGLNPGMPFDVVLGARVDSEFIPIASTSLKRAPRQSAGTRPTAFVTVPDSRQGPNGELEVVDYTIEDSDLDVPHDPPLAGREDSGAAPEAKDD